MTKEGRNLAPGKENKFKGNTANKRNETLNTELVNGQIGNK